MLVASAFVVAGCGGSDGISVETAQELSRDVATPVSTESSISTGGVDESVAVADSGASPDPGVDPGVDAELGVDPGVDDELGVEQNPGIDESPEIEEPLESVSPLQSDSEVTPSNIPATVADITDLVLVTGQSNTLGAGTSTDEFLDAPNRRVFAFTENGWEIASLNQVWDRGFPLDGNNPSPSNNFSLHFGKRLADRRPDRVVGFILVSEPGASIDRWREGGALFEVIRARVSQAINELPFKSRLDGILWHQGESNGADDDAYGDALYDLITRFRSEPWIDFGFPFICGETATLPVNRQLQKLNTDSDPWTACIEAEGLPTIRDDAHFSAEALRTMGGRYADAYIELYLGL